MPTADDEFAEFETDETTFDAMFARAEPAELVDRRTEFSVRTEHGADVIRFAVGLPISVGGGEAAASSTRFHAAALAPSAVPGAVRPATEVAG